MRELELKCGQTSVRLEIACDVLPNGWCTIYYYDGDSELRLGANDAKTVFTKLLTGLSRISDRAFFIYQDVELFTVMNVMDSHSTIAGREADDRLELFHISTDGEITKLACLTDEIKRQWITDVISFLMEVE